MGINFPAQFGLTFNQIARILGQARFSNMMAAAPVAVTIGGALSYAGGDFIFAFQGGNTTAFWRYTISTNVWTVMAAAPVAVAGGALSYTGGDFI
ncbi:MAG TPA: hypothetical protein VLH15_04345, partial [Dehalococcoidales bacterium]|nr:hypothetical protein [Dehalococcoidales bacterium]